MWHTDRVLTCVSCEGFVSECIKRMREGWLGVAGCGCVVRAVFLTKVKTEALPCGHTFHSLCLDQAVVATKQPRAALCPLRCSQPKVLVPITTTHLVDENDVEQEGAISDID